MAQGKRRATGEADRVLVNAVAVIGEGAQHVRPQPQAGHHRLSRVRVGSSGCEGRWLADPEGVVEVRRADAAEAPGVGEVVGGEVVALEVAHPRAPEVVATQFAPGGQQARLLQGGAVGRIDILFPQGAVPGAESVGAEEAPFAFAQQGHPHGSAEVAPAAGAVGDVVGIEGGHFQGCIGVEAEHLSPQDGLKTEQVACFCGLGNAGCIR